MKNRLRLEYEKKKKGFKFEVRLENLRRNLNLCIDFNDAINMATTIIDNFVKRKGNGISIGFKHMTTCADFLKICFLRILKNLLPDNFEHIS